MPLLYSNAISRPSGDHCRCGTANGIVVIFVSCEPSGSIVSSDQTPPDSGPSSLLPRMKRMLGPLGDHCGSALQAPDGQSVTGRIAPVVALTTQTFPPARPLSRSTAICEPSGDQLTSLQLPHAVKGRDCPLAPTR